jgi:hypothetical protein
MGKRSKERFEELYKKNLQSIMEDTKQLELIEERIDKRHMNRLES